MHRVLPADTDDFVVHIRPTKDVNRQGAAKQLRTIVKALEPTNPVVLGNPGNGCTFRVPVEDILKQISDNSNLHVTYATAQDAYSAFRILQMLDTGLSVSVAGPLEEIFHMAADLDMSPDSVLLDLGTFGAAPETEEYVSEIVSLCGHMRISPLLVRDVADRVLSGEATREEAASRIGRICRCGCFNTVAAAGILQDEIEARS